MVCSVHLVGKPSHIALLNMRAHNRSKMSQALIKCSPLNPSSILGRVFEYLKRTNQTQMQFVSTNFIRIETKLGLFLETMAMPNPDVGK